MSNYKRKKCVDSTGREFNSIRELCKYHKVSQTMYYNTREYQKITEPADIIDYCLAHKNKYNYKNNLKHKRRVNDVRKHTTIEDIKKFFTGEKKRLW